MRFLFVVRFDCGMSWCFGMVACTCVYVRDRETHIEREGEQEGEHVQVKICSGGLVGPDWIGLTLVGWGVRMGILVFGLEDVSFGN
jgi:hypothetical protein